MSNTVTRQDLKRLVDNLDLAFEEYKAKLVMLGFDVPSEQDIIRHAEHAEHAEHTEHTEHEEEY